MPYVYRHFDKDGVLLYVGYSVQVLGRLAAHRRSPWAKDIAKITIESYETEEEALEAERQAIRAEDPRHNKSSWGPSPRVPAPPRRPLADKFACSVREFMKTYGMSRGDWIAASYWGLVPLSTKQGGSLGKGKMITKAGVEAWKMNGKEEELRAFLAGRRGENKGFREI